jgi:hypothetical protein
MNAGEPANLRARAASSGSTIPTVNGVCERPMSSSAARSNFIAFSAPGHSGITSSSTSTPASWLGRQCLATARKWVRLTCAGWRRNDAPPLRHVCVGFYRAPSSRRENSLWRNRRTMRARVSRCSSVRVTFLPARRLATSSTMALGTPWSRMRAMASSLVIRVPSVMVRSVRVCPRGCPTTLGSGPAHTSVMRPPKLLGHLTLTTSTAMWSLPCCSITRRRTSLSENAPLAARGVRRHPRLRWDSPVDRGRDGWLKVRSVGAPVGSPGLPDCWRGNPATLLRWLTSRCHGPTTPRQRVILTARSCSRATRRPQAVGWQTGT